MIRERCCMCFSSLRKRRGRLLCERSASRRSALLEELFSPKGSTREIVLQMLERQCLRAGEGVEDGPVSGAAVRDHRHAADTEQGSAAHLLVVDALLHLVELRLHQERARCRHPAGLHLALEELAEG